MSRCNGGYYIPNFLLFQNKYRYRPIIDIDTSFGSQIYLIFVIYAMFVQCKDTCLVLDDTQRYIGPFINVSMV